MLRQVIARNGRSRRALEHREPKAVENPKMTLVLRAAKASQVVQAALNDLHSLRTPFSRKLTKRNEVRPFEDPSSLEFLGEKNDCSTICLGSSTKKHPHTLLFARTFGHKLLDMVELYLDPATFRPLAAFRADKPPVGVRPMLVFAGAGFESAVPDGYTLARSILLDLFKGDSTATMMDVEGLRYVILVATGDPGPADPTPPIRLRGYMIRTRRSGQSLPRVEVEETGPRMDLRIGRTRHADESVWKQAVKQARRPEDQRPRKNVVTDPMGDSVGTVHTGRQDLAALQTRKFKGLKRARDEDEEEAGAGAGVVDTKKKSKA